MKKNPAVRSMLTIALYLVLLIGMWSVIGKWVYPTVTDRSRAEELAKKHSPLLIQLAENSADGEQWAGTPKPRPFNRCMRRITSSIPKPKAN